MTLRNVEKFLTPNEVALRFAVDPKTVTRWAKEGKIPSIKTPGGHRRYRASLIEELTRERFEGEKDPADDTKE